MPATGWTTSSSRSSVSPPPSPVRSPRRRDVAVAEAAASAALTALAVVVLLIRPPRPCWPPEPCWSPLWSPPRVRSALVGPGVLLAVGHGGCQSCRRACVLVGPWRSTRASRDAPRRSRRCALGRLELDESCLVALGRAAASELGAGRRIRVDLASFCARRSVPVGGRAVGLSCPLAFLNRGDEFVLAHARRPLDAGSISQRAQFGQHHGGQRARRARWSIDAVVWASEVSVVTAFDS